MATRLYLNNCQVYADDSQSIKLTKENPQFTQSGSYTLDVTLPMSILANRSFFKNINRIESSKKTSQMSCRLIVDNTTLLEGTARIAQISESEVKVQLLGEKSELNYISKENKVYIDQMYLGSFIGFGIWMDYNFDVFFNDNDDIIADLPTHDETNGQTLNRYAWSFENNAWNKVSGAYAVQPRLLYVIKGIIAVSGYKMGRCDFDCTPWNRLYVATAKQSDQISDALPHWLVNEFIDEVCKFFNCRCDIDPLSKTVNFISNLSYYKTAKKTTITPIDEYSAETSKDTKAFVPGTSNVEFSFSDSEAHRYECLSDSLRKSIPKKYCKDKTDAYATFRSLSEEERMRYAYATPSGLFAGWVEDGKADLRQVDFFAPLIRNEADSDRTSLKICPVALDVSEEALWYGYPNPGTPRLNCVVASLENPTGTSSSFNEETPTVQDAIENDETMAAESKEDLLQVMFIDNIPQTAEVTSGSEAGKTLHIDMPFTDYEYLKRNGTNHESWSLALNCSGATHYLGQLHQTEYSINSNVKYCVKFLSETIPDPSSIFIIRNKSFVCEKIEVHVDYQGIQRIMTGYFYEISL